MPAEDGGREQQRTFERPIDQYPRIRDSGRWVLSSGILQAPIAIYFAYRAWSGVEPLVSAAFAILSALSAAVLFSMND